MSLYALRAFLNISIPHFTSSDRSSHEVIMRHTVAVPRIEFYTQNRSKTMSFQHKSIGKIPWHPFATKNNEDAICLQSRPTAPHLEGTWAYQNY